MKRDKQYQCCFPRCVLKRIYKLHCIAMQALVTAGVWSNESCRMVRCRPDVDDLEDQACCECNHTSQQTRSRRQSPSQENYRIGHFGLLLVSTEVIGSKGYWHHSGECKRGCVSCHAVHGSINWPLKFARYMESQEIVSIRSSANTFWNWILVYENVCLWMAQNAFINVINHMQKCIHL